MRWSWSKGSGPCGYPQVARTHRDVRANHRHAARSRRIHSCRAASFHARRACLRRRRFAAAKRFAWQWRRSDMSASRVGGGCRLAQRPAVGYGLRPSRDCARCSAARASSNQVTAMTRHRLPGGRMAPSPSTRARKARRPWPPARLAAPDSRDANPRRPARASSPRLVGKDIEVRSRRRARTSHTRRRRAGLRARRERASRALRRARPPRQRSRTLAAWAMLLERRMTACSVSAWRAA